MGVWYKQMHLWYHHILTLENMYAQFQQHLDLEVQPQLDFKHQGTSQDAMRTNLLLNLDHHWEYLKA
eukprot:12889052-Prorocentrum_lima.AAC.1